MSLRKHLTRFNTPDGRLLVFIWTLMACVVAQLLWSWIRPAFD